MRKETTEEMEERKLTQAKRNYEFVAPMTVVEKISLWETIKLNYILITKYQKRKKKDINGKCLQEAKANQFLLLVDKKGAENC